MNIADLPKPADGARWCGGLEDRSIENDEVEHFVARLRHPQWLTVLPISEVKSERQLMFVFTSKRLLIINPEYSIKQLDSLATSMLRTETMRVLEKISTYFIPADNPFLSEAIETLAQSGQAMTVDNEALKISFSVKPQTRYEKLLLSAPEMLLSFEGEFCFHGEFAMLRIDVRPSEPRQEIERILSSLPVAVTYC